MSEEDLDVYAIVGGSIDADISTIRTFYKRRARELHPDKNPDNPNAAADFDRLRKAYELLMNEEWKDEYDRKIRAKEALHAKYAQDNAQNKELRRKMEQREREAKEAQKAETQMSAIEKARYQTSLFLDELERKEAASANTNIHIKKSSKYENNQEMKNNSNTKYEVNSDLNMSMFELSPGEFNQLEEKVLAAMRSTNQS